MMYGIKSCGLQGFMGNWGRTLVPNHAKGVDNINSVGIVYHQRLAVVYHQAAGKCTLKRDDIQPHRG